MTLINCPECNKRISDKSEHCVECGAPKHVILNSAKEINKENDSKEKSDISVSSNHNEWNDDKEIYIVYSSKAVDVDEANNEVENLQKAGYKNAGFLHIPNFVSFSGINRYIIFSSKHDTSEECALEVDQQLKTNPKAFGYFVSKFREGVQINGVGKIKSLKFNNSNPLYRPIKITNVLLIILLALVETAVQTSAGRSTANLAPVAITFLLSRGWIRHIFLRKPQFRVKSIPIKLGTTFLIWMAVFVIKTLIVGIILNVAV